MATAYPLSLLQIPCLTELSLHKEITPGVLTQLEQNLKTLDPSSLRHPSPVPQCSRKLTQGPKLCKGRINKAVHL